MQPGTKPTGHDYTFHIGISARMPISINTSAVVNKMGKEATNRTLK